MENGTFLITGRITREDGQTGVHGLLVEIWGNDTGVDDCLGKVLTNRNGSFAMAYKESDSKILKDSLEIYIKIRDRDDRLIYDTKKDVRKCLTDKPLDYKISLDDKVLTQHFSRPLSWECPMGPLVPKEKTRTIEDAISPITPQGIGRVVFARSGMCPWPPLYSFDNITMDAWQVLEGDLEATIRFRDALEVIYTKKPRLHNKKLEDIIPGEWLKKPEAVSDQMQGMSLQDSFFSNPCNCKGIDNPDAPDEQIKASFVPPENAALLVMAAFHASGGNQATAGRYVITVLNELCTLDLFGKLYTAAEMAIKGSSRGTDQFRGMFNLLECGPADEPWWGLEPCPKPDPCSWWIIETVRATGASGLFPQSEYVINSITPSRACSGEIITIRGSNFGNVPGKVLFGGTRVPVLVTPRSWSDTVIIAEVPENAGCRLELIIHTETIKICGRFIDIYKRGRILASFESNPKIVSFYVNNKADSACSAPGVLSITWKTCGADRVRVEILNEGGVVLDSKDPAVASGNWDYDTTSYSSTTSLVVRIVAEGTCEPRTVEKTIAVTIQRPYNLTVDGMEITQAIQYYHADQHLTDPADRGPDNSLRLVVNKAAWVRVYMRSGQDQNFEAGQLPQVTGILKVEQRVNNVWNLVSNLNPQNGPIAVQARFVNYNAERGDINNSLNFIVPAGMMTGLLRFRVTVNSPYVLCGRGEATYEVTVDVNLQQTLQVAGIMINYNGPDAAGNLLNIAAPTLQNLQATAPLTQLMFPVSGNANFRVSGTITLNQPLNDLPTCAGCCSQNWVALLGAVQRVMNNDTNRGGWLFYGLLPIGVPAGGVIGCNNGAVSAGFAGNQQIMAHELGHQLGLAHSPCGPVGTTNAAPAYEPYDQRNVPSGSIGEYGLNINNGQIFNPAATFDNMSYCPPTWISIFVYNSLINPAGLNPVNVPTGLSSNGAGRALTVLNEEQDELKKLIIMQGEIDEDDKVSIISLVRIETYYPKIRGIQTEYLMELINKQSTVASSAFLERIVATNLQREGSFRYDEKVVYPMAVIAIMQNVTTGSCLRIRKGGKIIWQLDCPDTPTSLNKAIAKYSPKNDTVQLNWEYGQKATENPDVWVQYSNDKGKTWNGLAVDLKGAKAELDVSYLPPGEVLFKILAHDGFDTVTVETNSVKLPEKAPIISILHPMDGAKIKQNMPLHLWGAYTCLSYNESEKGGSVWYIDDKEVGRGMDIWINNPGKGTHSIRLKVSDSGGTSVAESKIEIV